MSKPILKRRQILKTVALTVFGTLVAWYVGAILSFAFSSYGFNNRFSEVAVQHHWWFLVWSNLVVLKGYFLVAAGYVAVIYPLVRMWGSVRSFERWGVVWRTLLFAGLLYGFFIVKLMLAKPFFGDYSYLLGWYDALGRLFGTGVQDAVHVLIAHVFPLTAIVAASGFYLFELRRWFAGAARPLLFSIGSVAGILALLVVSGYGVGHVPAEGELAGGKKRPKNIVILGSDSLRADHLSCNGYHRLTSPNIDRIAAKGVNFQRCLTPIASTLESLTSMFSSQYPHTHGVRHMFPNRAMVDHANREAPSLGAELQRRGYDTAVIGDWCACGFTELPMGFKDIIVSDFDNFRVYMSEAVFLHHQILPLFFDNRVGHMLFPKLKSFANYMTPEVVTDQVIDRLKQRAADRKPFLLFGYYSCTHLPYKTPTHYARLWTDPKYAGPHKHELALNVDQFIGGTDINEKWSKLPRQEVEQITALYDGCVRMFDDSVGRVVAELEKQGLMDDTIILITGDHGDDLFEPNCTFGHGTTFNGGDQANHVPAIFHIPGVDQPQRHSQIARTLDFVPTLLDLVGVPPEPHFEGASLAPVIRGEKQSLDLAFYGESSYLFFKRTIPGEEPLFIPPMDETTFIDPDFDFHFVLKDKFQEAVLKTKEHCVRTERFKYIRTPGVHHSIERLFDLREDPHCERDVKLRYPEVKARLAAAMDRWLTTHQQSTTAEIYGILGEDNLQPTAP
ncbi:sulfatase [Prosthecobacter sp.]|uniref:sulfatase n=1 Tax=Prosthecobacter sp. TaxID=1965333 RepID=UPI001D8B28D6|nr:sulfatase [Prosthecobacter sp.]MCB1277884.1 sulfatase-like hydrolase/transferase [Prosthecobacter sp.]